MKKVIFTFGRMNPPTVGHQKLVDKVFSVAKSEKGEPRIYLSHTQNNKKDPLSYDDKIRFAQKAFGKAVTKTRSKTVFQVVAELEKAGFTDLVMVVGSDRAGEFGRLLKKYNGKDYNFDSINVISAGQRDPDAQGVEGMSASKLRGLAVEGDFETFKTGLPKKLSDADAKKIYDQIRGIIKEDLDESLTTQQRFKRARLMKRLAPKLARKRKQFAKRKADPEKLRKRAQKAAIQVVRKKLAGDKGANYKDLSPADKTNIDKRVAKKKAMISKLAKKLLPKVRQGEAERVKKARETKKEEFELDINKLFESAVSQDKDIEDREGTQPKKYFKDLAKSTKKKRDAQFQKGKEADDDDASAYKPAPGDARAKTKTSKHTKKYHQMFGDKKESAVDAVKDKIEREKESDKRKHDAMMDRARTQDTQKKNTQTEEVELSESAMTALKKKSDKSGIAVGILKKVYDRGMAAWKTGHRPGATQQQWGFARVNSFITGGKTRTTADADLWKQHKGKKEDLDFLDSELSSLAEDYGRTTAPAGQYRPSSGKFDSEVMGYRRGTSKMYPGSHGVVMKQIARAQHILDDLKSKRATQMEVPQKTVNELKNLIAQIKRASDKLKGTSKNIYETGGAGEEGTDALVKKLKKDTPMSESLEEGFKVSDESKAGAGNMMFAKDFMKIQGGYEHHPDVQERLGQEECCEDCEDIFEQVLEEAEYQGKKVTLNDPIRTSENPNKKFKVYVKNDQGNVVVVRFGDPKMEIKRDDPKRRKSFRARHGCDNPGPKWKAKYWSCWQWRAGSKVDN